MFAKKFKQTQNIISPPSITTNILPTEKIMSNPIPTPPAGPPPSLGKIRNPKLSLIKPLMGTAMAASKMRAAALAEVDAALADVPLAGMKHEPSYVLFIMNLLENLSSITPPMTGEEKKEFVMQKIALLFDAWEPAALSKMIDFIHAAGLVQTVSTSSVLGRAAVKKASSFF